MSLEVWPVAQVHHGNYLRAKKKPTRPHFPPLSFLLSMLVYGLFPSISFPPVGQQRHTRTRSSAAVAVATAVAWQHTTLHHPFHKSDRWGERTPRQTENKNNKNQRIFFFFLRSGQFRKRVHLLSERKDALLQHYQGKKIQLTRRRTQSGRKKLQ